MMETIMQWGVEVILWFQQWSPALDVPFQALTFLGEEEFFLLLLPFVYWCLDRRTGARLTILLLLSTYVNVVAKGLAGQPRPFQYDARVLKLWDAGGGGLPSGHAQHATVVWGYLAWQFRRTWLWIVAVALIVLIALSRIYLGVHFPQDILGGYVLGAGLLFAFAWSSPRVEQALENVRLIGRLGIAFLVPVLLAIVFPTEDAITAVATLMGMGVGFVLEREWVVLKVGGVWWKRVLGLLLGVAVLGALWGGLKVLLAALEPALFFRFLRYSLVGLWGGVGAPWVLIKLRLAESERGEAHDL